MLNPSLLLALSAPLATGELLKVTFENVSPDRGLNPSQTPTFSKDATFALLADPQFGMYDSKINNGNGTKYEEEYANFQLTLEKLQAMDPKLDFALILGDMTNQMPLGSTAGHANARAEGFPESRSLQAHDILKLMNQADFPIFVLPGNHDVGDDFNSTALATYEEDFGLDYYYFKTEDSVFMNLCSQYFRPKEFVSMPEKTDQQWAWIEQKFNDWSLDESVEKVFISSHNAVYFVSADEDELVTSWPVAARDQLLELMEIYLESVGKPVYLFSGHTHEGRDTNEFVKNMNAVTTTKVFNDDGKVSDLDLAKHGGVRLAKLTAEGLDSQWFETDEIPTSYGSAQVAGISIAILIACLL